MFRDYDVEVFFLPRCSNIMGAMVRFPAFCVPVARVVMPVVFANSSMC